ncbi:hypothetical protein LTR27_011504 [Elasticomyces elasticus]|nr:hypothetical protein LTR27_011504 [Elasticomyces elasticus]
MAAPSPLLALPRELRNLIYEFIVVGEETLRVKQTLPSKNYCQLASRSSTLLTCKLISDEYIETLLKNTLDNQVVIEAQVTNLETARIQEFVCLLTPTQHAVLRAGPKLGVKLTFTTKLTAAETDNGIKNWSKFCETEGIGAIYEADETVGMATMDLLKFRGPDSGMAFEEKYLQCVLVMPVLQAAREQIDRNQEQRRAQISALRARIAVLQAEAQAIRAARSNCEMTGGGGPAERQSMGVRVKNGLEIRRREGRRLECISGGHVSMNDISISVFELRIRKIEREVSSIHIMSTKPVPPVMAPRLYSGCIVGRFVTAVKPLL